MLNSRDVFSRAVLMAGVCSLALPATALAQEQEEDTVETNREVVIVTARRREETDLSVPVAVTALSAVELENLAIDSFEDLASTIPSLSVMQLSAASGGGISLRGVGTSAQGNAAIEQTVTVNVDGVQVRGGNALRLGQFDMERVEVLRGSQALFFGKNSPAGVISITSKDPGDELEIFAKAGYEFNAEEKIIEGAISGPLSDTVGVRLAANWTDMEGWVHSQAADVAAAANAIVPGAVAAAIDDGPKYSSYMARGTIVWEPNDSFDLRGKISVAGRDGAGFQQGPNQRLVCPYGAPQLTAYINAVTPDPAERAALAPLLGIDDCTANDTHANGTINPAHLVNTPFGTDPEGLQKSRFLLTSVDANWYISPSITLTSVTGLLDIEEDRYDTYSYNPSSAVAGLNFGGPFTYDQLSQELRLASDFATSPFDFMVGLYVEESELTAVTRQFATPGPLLDQTVDGSAQSVFAQGMYDITDTVELSGGVRWTREERDLTVLHNGTVQPLAPSSLSYDNTSPEVTLTWRPNDDFTLFGSYREGFKSGGFSTSLTGGGPFTAPRDFSYRPESVEGVEVGMHASLADNQLRLNGSVYDYEFTDLQVNFLDNSSGIAVITAGNAASASVSGIEADFNWRPNAAPGFALRGAANYSDNVYEDYDAPCYIGQTIAEGCNLGLNTTTGLFQAQDLAGFTIPFASEWTGSLGASYEGALGGSDWGYRVSLDGTYRGEYNPHPELPPQTLQDSVVFVNGSIRLYAPNDQWEVALIGRNLTEEYRAQQASQAPISGNRGLSGSNTPGGLPDFAGFVNRGREILLQFTWRPTN